MKTMCVSVPCASMSVPCASMKCEAAPERLPGRGLAMAFKLCRHRGTTHLGAMLCVLDK